VIYPAKNAMLKSMNGSAVSIVNGGFGDRLAKTAFSPTEVE
jgi:NAD/NADP transhydrogenase beta subunit